MGFPGGSVVKNLTANERDIRDMGSIPGEENGNPLQYACLGNLVGTRAWQATVYGVSKNRTQLSTYRPYT